MLSCEQVLQDIWAYLDGEMEEVQIIHIRKHIELCRGCFSRVEFEQLLRISIQKKTHRICPDKVKNRIKNILDQY